MTVRTFILSILGGTCFFLLNLQDLKAGKILSETEGIAWGIQLNNSLSYTGFSNALVVAAQKNNLQWYGGPRLLTSDSYVPTKGPWGLNTGLTWFFQGNEKLRALVNLDYQLALLKPYNPHNLPERGLNTTHEFNLSYGFTYYFLQNIGIGNSIGFGQYLERFHDLQEDIIRTYSGYSGLIRIHIHYSF